MEKQSCKRKLLLVLWIGLSLITSCTSHMDEIKKSETGQDEIRVRLVVSRPYTGGGASGHFEAGPETGISEIQVLVFEEGAYKYRVPGISVSNAGTTTSFSARLLASDKILDLYIVANATAIVLAGEPQLNDTEDQVRARLQQEFPVSGSFSALPMFGRCHLPMGLKAGQIKDISGIKMLRAIARVDILVGDVPGFELTSIQAYRANERIQLISAQDTLTVTSPSVPVNSRQNVNTVAVPVTGNQSLAELYLPEAVAPPESEQVGGATCVVIGGKFGAGGGVTYYRIDFDPDNVNGGLGQILRNHRYIFTIRSVAGPGWPSPDEAANNRSAQINLEIKAWDETTKDMYFDTEHHFGVSAREVVLGSKKNSSAMIYVDTDIRDYTLQWSDEFGNISGTTIGILTNPYFKVEKSGDGNSLIVTALQTNNNTVERTGYFMITANRWQILINIRQVLPDASAKTICLLSFRDRLGQLGVNQLIPKINADSRGTGIRGILDNPDNFGPSGTVVCGGFNLLVTNASSNSITDAALAIADIVYCNYIANSALAVQDVLSVRRWLETDPKRVLMVSYDGNDVNVPILKEFLGSTQYVNWFTSNTGPFSLVGKSATNFFTDTGPFTVSPYAPVASGFSFQNYDSYHGEIDAGNAAGITPILNGPGGGITLGIDMKRRIVYLGDIDLFTSFSGTGGTSVNHINNTTGAISNDAAKLIANIFAWAVGIISGE